MVGSGAKKRGACFDKGRGFGAEGPPPSPKKRGGRVGWNTKTNLRSRYTFVIIPTRKRSIIYILFAIQIGWIESDMGLRTCFV